ncbi:putative WD repeat-containing protein alr3466 [Nostoc sp, PCC 7120] [Rhizoctonia solani]|uniref:Putative WD repeat-containing protein alr3466 [Nostoc sp, PCC 7120] n=1 Tax=Rhizoctonia solani TaxID=456999 RepID=A0A0K6G270_9AGAM|nr:putative WD repeat-containing protein alr3466 [Nostoc sp, PCC 7120] [Rhizoctonia solani]
MDSKRKFKLKWWKKKAPDSESHASPSRIDTPTPDASIRSASPPPGPSVAVSALVFQPFVPLPTLPPLEHRQLEPSIDDTDKWTNLTAFSHVLKQTTLFSPLAAVMDDLSWFIGAHEDLVRTRNEYHTLRSQLEELFKDLRMHFSGNTPPAMTISMLNLCDAIQTEIRGVYGTQDRNMISRYLQANQDLDKITGCYRRIQGHLERLMLNATMNIWKTVDRQTAEAELSKLNPSLSAYYDSAEANIVQRRECAPNTREQVLQDLQAWKDNHDGEKVCWINGMAGTGKTTIVNTLCSTLDNSHELGASFFCTRSIPSCRNVKLILPTIAYQLARFSSPFRGALLQVLEQDPDVHSKVPRVQFKRMILEPLQQVMRSLPSQTVIVIDALDECDDGNGVEQILEVLLENASKLPIKFLVSSRPEPHIRKRIRQSALKTQLILHELDQKMVKADIETYLRVELASIAASLTKDDLETLVKRAGLLFIYAATVVRYIKAGNAKERLAAVLKVSGDGRASSNRTKEIDRLYEAVLVSALDDENLEEPEKTRIQQVLHTVVCAQEPLTVDALAGLLSLEHTEVTDALKPLWSVLHVSESNTSHRISTLHASFPDYIFDSSRSKRFSCNAQNHNGALAELCLKRIERNGCQFNICNLESSYMFDEDVPNIDDKVNEAIPLDLLYACQYWAVHLSSSGRSGDMLEMVHEFLSKRLLLWMEVLSLTKRIDRAIRQMELAITWPQSMEHPEHVMLLARDARRFVTMFATSPVSRSTPHLYVSMLPSWPDHQPFAHHYIPQTRNLVQIKGVASAERQLGLLSSIPVGSGVFCVACSPGGKLITAGTYDQRILIWDAVTLQMTIDPIQGHSGPVRAVAFSPDGTRICSGSEDDSLCVWDPQNGQLVAGPLKGHDDRVWSVDYSPDGKWLASGSLDGTVCIWNTDTYEQKGGPLRPVGKRREMILSVVFSPDSAMIAAGYGSMIHLWDRLSGQLIGQPLEGHTDIIKSLVFSPNGKHLVSSSDDCSIRIWDTTSGQLAFGPFKEHTSSVCDVKICPGAHSLISVGEDDTVRLWETTTWQSRTWLKNTGIIRSARFLPDGFSVVTGSVDRSVRIWEVQQFSDEQITDHQLEGHSNWIASVAFSPCGTYIVSGSHDMTACIWDSQTKQLILGPLKHTNTILSVGVSADSSRIFSVSADRMIHVWSKQTGDLEYTIGPIETDGQEDPTYRELWPAALLFNGRRIVCGSKSGRIYMQDDNTPSCSLVGHNDQVKAIAFSPDEQTFASASEDGALMVWNANTREKLFEPLKAHSWGIFSVAFSPDGTQIASGSQDLTIRLWSSHTGLQLGEPFKGHTDTVRAVAFSPSGSQFVSGSQDRTVRVWDVTNGQPLAVFKGHTDDVLSVAFSPDGTQILSGSADTTIRLWNAPRKGVLPPGHEAILDQPASITKEHPNTDWDMGVDGWVRSIDSRLLLWVPPDLRRVLLRQQNTGLISRQGSIELDFSESKIGDKWVMCYEPCIYARIGYLPPISELKVPGE